MHYTGGGVSLIVLFDLSSLTFGAHGAPNMIFILYVLFRFFITH